MQPFKDSDLMKRIMSGKLPKQNIEALNSISWLKDTIITNENKVQENEEKGHKINKYRNTKTTYNGKTFDSIKEKNYYQSLEIAKQQEIIKDFEWQVPVRLEVNGKLVCRLIIDFKVWNDNGQIDYIDIKGFDKKSGKFLVTPDCRIKHKLFAAIYGYEIKLK